MKTPVVFTFHINWNNFEKFGPQQFNHIKSNFIANGIENFEFLPILTDTKTDMENRIKQFKRGIERIADKYESKCHVVSYSFAGVLPRGFIGLFNGDEYIKTLLTIASPNKGSSFVNNLISRNFRLDWQLIEPALRSTGVHRDWVSEEYSSKSMHDFNSMFIDSQNVKYYSVSGKREKLKCSETLRFINENLNSGPAEIPNDGLITSKEAEYGNHLITYDADHFELIDMRPNFDGRQLFELYTNALKNNDQEFLKISDLKINI